MRDLNFAIIIVFSVLLSINLSAQPLNNNDMKKIDTIFSDYNRFCSGASVIIIKNGEIIFSKGYGYADLKNKIPAGPNTNYRLASVSKQFTAMSVMMLMERGLVFLDDPLSKFFTDYPQWAENIKIENLLNHTSGIWDYESLIPDSQEIPVSDQDVYESIKQTDSLYFQPGKEFRYSNTAYVLLGLIIEKLSGMSFSEFLHKNIFAPLGMKNSRTNLIDAEIPERAYGYTEQNGLSFPSDQSVTSYTLGDGGVYSSVMELYKWDQSLYESPLVKESTLAKIFTKSSVISEEKKEYYGLGWYISEKEGRKCIWHSGDSRGFTNLFVRYPDEKTSFIILTNRNGADLEKIRSEIEQIIFN